MPSHSSHSSSLPAPASLASGPRSLRSYSLRAIFNQFLLPFNAIRSSFSWSPSADILTPTAKIPSFDTLIVIIRYSGVFGIQMSPRRQRTREGGLSILLPFLGDHCLRDERFATRFGIVFPGKIGHVDFDNAAQRIG
ncbi:hypothetical protein KC357_g268 [Hortaea werneckii]|nr:hypothetical protein KC357_g268 [Hortaea werneckii]